MNKKNLKILVMDENYLRKRIVRELSKKDNNRLIGAESAEEVILNRDLDYDIAIIHLSNDWIKESDNGQKEYNSLSAYLKDKIPHLPIIGVTIQEADYHKDFFTDKYYDVIVNNPLMGDFIDRLYNKIKDLTERK